MRKSRMAGMLRDAKDRYGSRVPDMWRFDTSIAGTDEQLADAL